MQLNIPTVAPLGKTYCDRTGQRMDLKVCEDRLKSGRCKVKKGKCKPVKKRKEK
jgi:hypothetical protein